MSKTLETLKKLRAEVRKYEDTIRHYEKIFADDGTISSDEQAQLDRINELIIIVKKGIQKRAKTLSVKNQQINKKNAEKERIQDANSTTDDVIIDGLMDEEAIKEFKSGKLDGLHVEVHSAYQTGVLLDWFMENYDVSAEELVKKIITINEKGFKDDDSTVHAILNYEYEGSLVSISKKGGDFRITGYTNAKEGDIINISIYMLVNGFIEVEIISPIDTPKPKQGMQQMTGVPGFAASFVMKYSGFGKLSRALTNYMEGKDPWTGEAGSTITLAIGGITDLLTMGLGGSSKVILGIKDLVRMPAITNILLNIAQETIEKISPQKLEELGLTREVIDIAISLSEENKYLKAIEIVSNLVQAGLVSEELIRKHLENNLTEEDLKTK
jgi:hypothetical protein